MHLDVSALETFGEESGQKYDAKTNVFRDSYLPDAAEIVEKPENLTVSHPTGQLNMNTDEIRPWMHPNPVDALKVHHSQVDGAMDENSSSSDEDAMVIGNLEWSSIN